MKYTAEQKQSLDKIYDKLKGQRVCMLTTQDRGTKRLHSRPMAIQETERDGTLWFFTYRNSEKADEIMHEDDVNLSFIDTSSDLYISISGRGRIIEDKKRMEELWNPILKAWFPNGLESKNLTLLQVEILEAEYWDSHTSKMVQLFHIAKSVFTGERADGMGKHEKLNIH